ncbi:MAG: nitroreductase [Pseudomonadota bacterium]|nr:nitroreductase [Pseudomonadota bacterium]
MDLPADQVFELIDTRQSVGLLTEPVPSATQLQQAIQAGLSAPDHHRLRPWQFMVVQGDARRQMGQVLSAALAAQGETDPQQLERVRQQPLRAPMILICVAKIQSHPKVPAFEQLLSAGAAIQNVLLMLHAQGFSTMWRTGALVEHPQVKSAFGLTTEDQIAGFVYVGTAGRELPPRSQLPVADFLSDWPASTD